MNKIIEKDKLENIFKKKYRELGGGLSFNESYAEHKWHIYLNSIECVRLSDNYKETFNYPFDYLILDPSFFGDYIQMSEETALKILALGDLP